MAVRLVAAASPGTTVRTGTGPGQSTLDRIPLVMLSRKGRTARFAAVLEPVREGQSPRVRSVEYLEDAGASVVTVVGPDGRETVTLGPDAGLTVTVAGEVVLKGQPASRK